MSTAYSVIRNYSRIFLGDIDPTLSFYTDSVLNSQINLVIATLDEPTIIGDVIGVDDLHFTTDLSNKDKVRLALRVALNIIGPQNINFSYRTPILSVVRGSNNVRLFSYLTDQLTNVEGGGLVFESDNELDAYFGFTTRYLSDITNAIANISTH